MRAKGRNAGIASEPMSATRPRVARRKTGRSQAEAVERHDVDAIALSAMVMEPLGREGLGVRVNEVVAASIHHIVDAVRQGELEVDNRPRAGRRPLSA